jgi:putative acyl-CoA dehydrogenase
LAAARDLQRSESPLRTRVSALEATPRPGGKIRTESFSDEVVRLDGRVPAWGFQANENPSELRVHDRYGHRVDEIRFHPAWHRLMDTAIAHGLHALPRRAAAGRGAHVARAALFYLLTQAEAGHGCPISMTHAAVPVLRTQPELTARWEPLLTSTDYDPRPRERV